MGIFYLFKGLKAFEQIKDTPLPPMDINAPKKGFESRMVQAYNNCRKQYIYKYLWVLTSSEVSSLLKDNYIQKKDVKRVLKR